MNPFEYVIVLISIILGLGITTILTGVADWVKHIRLSTIYTPYLIWIILVFVLHLHEWFESYSLQAIEVWRLPMFLFVILYPINLYVLAHLLFPRDMENFNSKEYYFRMYPKFFVSVLGLNVLSIIHNLVIGQQPFETQLVIVFIFVMLTAVLISKSKNEIVHLSIVSVLLLILIATLIFTQDTFLIGGTPR